MLSFFLTRSISMSWHELSLAQRYFSVRWVQSKYFQRFLSPHWHRLAIYAWEKIPKIPLERCLMSSSSKKDAHVQMMNPLKMCDEQCPMSKRCAMENRNFSTSQYGFRFYDVEKERPSSFQMNFKILMDIIFHSASITIVLHLYSESWPADRLRFR